MFLILSKILYPLVVFLHLMLLLSKKISLKEFQQKCGFSNDKRRFSGKLIWVHVSSLGEYNSATLILTRLCSHYDAQIFLTYFNADVAKKASGDDRVSRHQFLPFENSFAYIRLFKTVEPIAVFLFETEIWPVFLAVCKGRAVPTYLLSGYMYESAFRSYKRLRSWFKPSFNSYTKMFVQSTEDYERFFQLGAPPDKLEILGNLKYDIALPERTLHEERRNFFLDEESFVFTAGSVHKEEDILILSALLPLLKKERSFVLVIAPRNPGRIDAITNFLNDKKIPYYLRSQLTHRNTIAYPVVYILDTFGELSALYAASNLVFVGGSLVPIGGHNILEPIYYNRKTLTGLHTDHFTEMIELFRPYLDIVDENNLCECVEKYLSEGTPSENGKSLLNSLSGVGDKYINALSQF